MENIVFIPDENLADVDLELFKSGMVKLTEFIYNQTYTLIGSKKLFGKDIIKKILLEEGKEDSFAVKVSMNKSRAGNLTISMFTQSPNSVICIRWKREYVTREDLETDIEYLISNLENIKPATI